jgi:hypothetical protein
MDSGTTRPLSRATCNLYSPTTEKLRELARRFAD